MSQEQWLKAAEYFEQQKAEATRQAAEDIQATKMAAIQQKEEMSQELKQYFADLQTATEELTCFISSDEGTAAQKLLSASGQHIIITEQSKIGQCYFLDGNGLQLCRDSSIRFIKYAHTVSEQKISPATPKETAQLALCLGAEPLEIVGRIRQQLDRIAAEVL